MVEMLFVRYVIRINIFCLTATPWIKPMKSFGQLQCLILFHKANSKILFLLAPLPKICLKHSTEQPQKQPFPCYLKQRDVVVLTPSGKLHCKVHLYSWPGEKIKYQLRQTLTLSSEEQVRTPSLAESTSFYQIQRERTERVTQCWVNAWP